jgi:hypothetical protein
MHKVMRVEDARTHAHVYPFEGLQYVTKGLREAFGKLVDPLRCQLAASRLSNSLHYTSHGCVCITLRAHACSVCTCPTLCGPKFGVHVSW